MKTQSRNAQRSAPTDAARLLFSAYHLRMLAVLLMRPDERFHVRELERQTGINAGTLHRELKRMETAGLLTMQRVGNQVLYAANPQCNIMTELQSILRKTVGLADVLREALTPLSARIDAAFVFGSIARGEEAVHSDVDLMVIGAASFDEVVAATYDLEARLGRRVNPVVLTREQFAERRVDSAFFQRVLSGPRIPLLGRVDDAR
jgi:predicted nucleotidyltransferase